MTTDYATPAGGVATPFATAVPFKKRKPLLWLGIALLVLAVVNLGLGLISYLSILSFYIDVPSLAFPGAFNVLNPIILLLVFVALAVSGIMLLSDGIGMRRRGVATSWCVIGGIADLLLAGAVFFAILSSTLALNYELLMDIINYDYSFYSILMTLMRIPGWLLCVGAGALYIVAGFAQKKAGRANYLMFIAGILFVVYPLFEAVVNVAAGTLDPVTFYGLHIVVGVILFAGRALRGLAPLQFPKTLAPVYQQPTVQYNPYQTPPGV